MCLSALDDISPISRPYLTHISHQERFSALGAAKHQLAEELQAREREAAEEAKAHAAAEAKRGAQIASLNPNPDPNPNPNPTRNPTCNPTLILTL